MTPPRGQTSDASEPVATASEAPRRAARRPRPRIRPEELAAARGGAIEGLAWLGRTPEVRASLGYRLLALIVRAILFGVLRFRVDTAGRENLPLGGGYLLVGAAHRGWMDPFLVLHALPLQPRAWFLGSGPSVFAVRWREWLVHRVGGLLPVWRGGVGIDQHVRSARAVLDARGVFVQMPEGNINGPAGRVSPFRPGAALIALRTGAPIVPFAMAGTEELYLGKRMASRILPPVTFAQLVGDGWDGTVPAPDSREELELARRATDALQAILGPAAEALHPATVDPPGRPRPLRRRLTRLLLGPGPIER